jgi:hypothetical protein
MRAMKISCLNKIMEEKITPRGIVFVFVKGVSLWVVKCIQEGLARKGGHAG